MPSSSHLPPGCRVLTRMFFSVSAAVTVLPRSAPLAHSTSVAIVGGVSGGGVVHLRGGQSVERHRLGSQRLHRLDVGGITRLEAADVGVLTDLALREELLRCAAAHRTGRRRHDHVLDAEPAEDPLVGVAMRPVRLGESFVGEVEGVRVLHDELAAAENACPRALLVAVLGLHLVQGDREILVRVVLALDGEREQFLVGGAEQVVAALAVLQPEQSVAVLGPAVGRLVRFARQERGQGDLLGTDAVHLFPHHPLDLTQHAQTQRQPRVDAGRDATHITGADQQLVAGGPRRRRGRRAECGGTGGTGG